MKDRALDFSLLSDADSNEPVYLISIEFAPASFEYFASHAGIPDKPAGTIEGVLEDFSSVSQSVKPDTGASRIGSLTVLLGDLDGIVTDTFQARLALGQGARGKRLKFYAGFAGLSFNDFEEKWTQDIHDASESRARYRLACSDLQRALRSDIFEAAETNLDATLSAVEASMTVADTTDFVMVAHGTSYSHGPSATWGYVQIGDEVIGYTGKTGTTFTGLARGLFNTLPAEHVVDGADPPERRPEVVEYVYLEMPIPKLVKALQTGVLHGQGANLPATWHMGLAAALLDDSQFTGIGLDLWDPANDAVGLIANFTGIEKIDGKRFLETECYLLAQIFSPVLADGRMGLKRFTPALASAGHVAVLDPSNVARHSALKHEMRKVFNRIVLNWSWVAGEFRRQTIKFDTDSIAKHGEAPIKVYSFRGLAANIATLSTLTARFDAIRDRFSAPPLSMSVDVSKRLDVLELGDVVRVALPNVRDMSASSVNPIDRAFEIVQIRENRKKLTFQLSGSAADSVPEAPDVDALPDAFYTGTGTELSTVVDITSGVTDAGTFTLVGAALLKNGVFYYDGDLTISASTTILLDDNVQLRVKGFLTLNGAIDGAARGLPGVVDSGSTATNPFGTKGFLGSAAGGDGAFFDPEFPGFNTRRAQTTAGLQGAVPFLNLAVVGNVLNGIPDSILGTSGGPGGKVANEFNVQQAAGGTGGPGGAALMIISRGMSLGGGASIDLGGGDGLSALSASVGGETFFGGGGGGGAPGALYVLLDGDRLVPSIASKHVAVGGDVPLDGTPLPEPFVWTSNLLAATHTGMRRNVLALIDYADAAFRVQFVPVPETPVEDVPGSELRFYILATAGNQIKNGIGSLTLQARRVLAGTDALLATGTIKLFDPGNNEITVGNGYAAGSDGFTGVFDSGDISGSIVVTMKDGASGAILDSITLVDTLDGVDGGDGTDGADGADGGTGQRARTVTIFRKNSAVISAGSGTFADPLSGNAAWSFNVPDLTTDLDIVYVAVRTLTDDAAAPEDAAWGTPTIYAVRVDGDDGSPGDPGDTGQRARTVTIFRKNSASISTGSGSFANPLAGNAAWSFSVPAITADSDQIFISVRTFTDDAASPQDAAWPTPTIYAQRTDGTDGSDGDPGSDGSDGSDGADGVLHYLTNEAHVIPSNFDGTGYDTGFSGAGGTHKVFDGTVDKTTVAVHSVVSPATKNGLTISVVSGTGVYSLSGASWTTDIETFTVRAVYNAVNYDKTYTIVKAKQGSDGGCSLDTLTNANLIDSGVGGTREVGFRCHSDGKIYEYDGPASSFGSAKETYIGVCANSSYECRLNKTSGTTPTGSAINQWLLCSTTRTWEWSTTSFETFDGTFRIRRVSDDAILATVDLDVFIDAGV